MWSVPLNACLQFVFTLLMARASCCSVGVGHSTRESPLAAHATMLIEAHLWNAKLCIKLLKL